MQELSSLLWVSRAADATFRSDFSALQHRTFFTGTQLRTAHLTLQSFQHSYANSRAYSQGVSCQLEVGILPSAWDLYII